MALTITTDLTVITNGNDGTWTDVGGGGGSGSEPDYFVQGTGSRSRAVSGASASRGMTVDIGAGNTLDFSSGGTEEDMLVYFWIQDYTPGLTDNVATAPGLTIRISEGATNGSDYAEWDIAYSDLLAPPGTEFFRIYVLDPRAPPTRTSGTWDYNACRHFGAVLDTNATAKGQNLGIDRISYGLGRLKVTGTATDATSGFEEMVDENWRTVNDSVAIGSTGTARNGIIVNKAGINFIKGRLVIGDSSGTLATNFTGQDTIFQWEDTFYYDGTRVRSAVGYDHSGNFTGTQLDGTPYYGISLEGNATNDTDVRFGAIVGTESGRSGPTFIGSQITPTTFEADDGAVEDVLIYGTTFQFFRSINMSSNAATDDLNANTFKNCGTLDIGPVIGRNNLFINGIGGAYTFLETFRNIEGAADEALATADPTTEWTATLNGGQLTIPTASAEYLELGNGDNNTHVVVLDDDKMGSNSHYAEAIVNFPSGGASQGTLGVVINAAAPTTQDYYYFEVDLVNDQVSLIEVNSGTDTTRVGPTSFTMDEDEDYLIHLRHDGTNVEAFISGNSVADGFHTANLEVVEATHTANRRVGIRGDASTSQTGDAPRIRLFGAGPITDNLGSLIFPATASEDFEDANFINCARALSWDTTGTYTLNNLTISNSLVGAHNDSGGLVTGSFVAGSGVPANSELVGSSTVTFTADVNLTITVIDTAGDPIQTASVRIQEPEASGGAQIAQGTTNASGVFSATYNYAGDQAIEVIVRKSTSGSTRYFPEALTGTITNTGFTLSVTLRTDTIASA